MKTVQNGTIPGRLLELRGLIEKGFSPETAAAGFRGTGPSTGQCAATAIVVREVLGGEFLSALVEDQSHWFNRVPLSGRPMDLDLTGDQFGLPAVQLTDVDQLYVGTRVRSPSDVDRDTLRRAIRLAEQAGMQDIRRRLERWSATTAR